MPTISRRRCSLAASRTCPPGLSAASNSTTLWPRAALTRAASRPAGPAPTTTTFFLGAGRRRDDVRHRRFAAWSPDCAGTRPRCPGRCGRCSSRRRRTAGCGSPRRADLGDDMRVGHMRAGHADQVDRAGGDGVARGGDVVDAGSLHHRQLHQPLHLARQIEMRAGRRAHAGNDVRQRLVGADIALDHVDEVDQAALRHVLRDLQARPCGCRPSSTVSSTTMRRPTM